jgi:IS30 family transposase
MLKQKPITSTRGSSNPLSIDDKKKIQRLYRTFTRNELAAAVGCHINTIDNHLKRRGLTAFKPVSETDRKQMHKPNSGVDKVDDLVKMNANFLAILRREHPERDPRRAKNEPN